MSEATPIALITGAAKRIGRHLALGLAKKGWHIAGTYNSSDQDIATLAAEVEALGKKFLKIKVDLSQADDVATCLPNCMTGLGPPTLLINNASLFAKDEVTTLTSDSFDQHMAINLKAPLLLAQTMVKALDNNEKAVIINMTDQRVQNPGTSFYTYTLSKIGLASATETMALALAPHVRVNAIAPGPVLQSIHQTQEEFQAEWGTTPLEQGTSLEEIMQAVNFILQTPSMTGTTLYLDGGQRLI